MTNHPIARRKEIAAVYGAGWIQGVALVTFPAASVVFTSASDYGLSRTEYGGMFVPQAITAIGSALLAAGLARRLGVRRIYLIGLVTNLASMALLVLSRFVISEHALAYVVLLVATGCLGVGFGFTVPTLNTFAAAFFPQKVDKAVLALNALLGSGTALAPVFVAAFVGMGIWWGLPVLVGALILGLLLFSARLPLTPSPEADGAGVTSGRTKFPSRFWAFAGFALLYGVCETMNGNWASLYMTKEMCASTTQVAGGLIASYQIGYGIAAFGVGPLESRLSLSLGAIYGGTTGVALALAVLAVLIARRPARLVTEAPRARI